MHESAAAVQLTERFVSLDSITYIHVLRPLDYRAVSTLVSSSSYDFIHQVGSVYHNKA